MNKKNRKNIHKDLSAEVLLILADQENVMYIISYGELIRFVFLDKSDKFEEATMRDIYRVLDKKKFGKAKDSCFIRISSIKASYQNKQNLIVIMPDYNDLTVARRKLILFQAMIDDCPTAAVV